MIPKNPAGQNRGVIPQSPNNRAPKPRGNQGEDNAAARQGRPEFRGVKPQPKIVKPELDELELPDLSIPTHTSEYDFGETSKVKRNPDRFSNRYDKPEDDTFTPIDLENQIEDAESDSYEEEERLEREAIEKEKLLKEARARRAAREKALAAEREAEAEAEAEELDLEDEEDESVKKPSKSKAKKTRGNKKDAKGQDVFIDEKNLKLESFGGNKKIKVNDFDERKNLRIKNNVSKYIALGLLTTVVLLGAKSAIFPAKSLSILDVQSEIAMTAGITGFPMEGGKGFATDFMKSYLTANSDSISAKVLGYYYRGALTEEDSPNRLVSQEFQQKVLYGPTVYDSTGLTEHSASYTIGAIVEPLTKGAKAPNDGSVGQWVFFNVNVYYDEVTDSYSIPSDSPTVVPAVEVMTPAEAPQKNILGTGETDELLTEDVKSVVHGFMEGYAVTTPSNSEKIDQYIVSSEDADLKKGLAGSYSFAGSKDDAIKYMAYLTEDPNEVKIAVNVTWKNASKTNNKATIEYKSNYIMTLEKQSNEKYLVSKFAPEYYVASDALEK